MEAGFRVCCKCGKTLGEGEPEGPHSRDYFVRSTGVPFPLRCDGEFKRVLLGYSFVSDVLLLRIELADPIRFDVSARRQRAPIEDALRTLCEALTLSIGRVLDVDPNEVSAGYRFGNDGSFNFADIFIYDTLSGGAGYAVQAGASFGRIFDMAKGVMAGCTCASSCENCLRHYGNRFSHSRLDRQLGLDLADYIEQGNVPGALTDSQQLQVLAPLLDMVTLAGGTVACEEQKIIVTHNGAVYQLSACPSIRACDFRRRVGASTLLTFSPYEISRDLPSAFAELR